jgi:hypothetical protein
MKLAIFLTLIACVSVNAQDAAKQIDALTSEVEHQLKTLTVSNDVSQMCTREVADTRANLKKGNVYLGLYLIRNCKLELASQAYAASKADIAKKGVDAFEAEWRELGSRLAEKEKLVSASNSKETPALVLALAQVAQVQTKPYYQSGRLYGLNSSLSEGLYYLGRAPANLDFAILARNLKFPDSKSQLSYRSVETELSKLEADTLRAYKTSDISTQQNLFNRLNSNLKVTGELNKASMFQGALLKYLESEMFFGQLVTTSVNEDLNQLRTRTNDVEKHLKSAKSDQSIGLLFCQLAQASLNPVSNEPPTEAQIKRAFVILNRVLPAYSQFVKELKND